tara:strand:+ start:98 stop:787 length:690 start_codon:yes stop_codon:yes gene_type:complete
MNELIEQAFIRLFPNEKLNYNVKTTFSKKFSPYNANVKKIGSNLVFNLSHEWKTVNEEIRIGLIQELMLKILRKKAKTTNIDLYNNFIKNLHLSAQKTQPDEQLSEIFNKINSKYFHNSIERPNLKWNLNSRRRLATYDYHTDTINVSTLFKNADEELIAYLLYHEMLHKKLKFNNNSGRAIHHSKQFRELENMFENQKQIEKRLNSFIRKKEPLPIQKFGIIRKLFKH